MRTCLSLVRIVRSPKKALIAILLGLVLLAASSALGQAASSVTSSNAGATSVAMHHARCSAVRVGFTNAQPFWSKTNFGTLRPPLAAVGNDA